MKLPSIWRRLPVLGGTAIFISGCFVLAAHAQTAKVYQNLAVQAFEMSDASSFPPDFAEALRRDLVKHLQDTKRFHKITFVESVRLRSSTTAVEQSSTC